ncbi:MAG: hypothetical protein WA789_16185 [Candidatus Acidiferrum sp.]
MGKLDAVAERSAGCENGIPQAHRANLHGQVNTGCGTHFAPENSTNFRTEAILYAILDF